jgi:hypothetical protein
MKIARALLTALLVIGAAGRVVAPPPRRVAVVEVDVGSRLAQGYPVHEGASGAESEPEYLSRRRRDAGKKEEHEFGRYNLFRVFPASLRLCERYSGLPA